MKLPKTEILILLVSLLITGLISTVFGFAGRAIMGTFQAWFWVSFLIQVILFAAWNSYLIQRDRVIESKLLQEELELLSRFVVKLSCAYCGFANQTPVRLNQKNAFKCDSCGQVNAIHMQFTAATLTTPIESVKVPVAGESVEFKVTR